MIQLVKKIASSQEEPVKKFQLENKVEKVSNIAGVKLQGGVPASKYKEVFTNLYQFKDVWRKYKEDSNKAVIEKNFALSIFEKLGGYFLWRHISSDSSVGLRRKESYEKYRSYSWGLRALYGLVALSLSALICVFFAIGMRSAQMPSFVWQIPIGVYMLWMIGVLLYYQFSYKKRRQQWVEITNGSPILLFDETFYSVGGSDIKVDILIQNENQKIQDWYFKVLQEMFVDAKDTGTPGWLWAWYGLKSNPPFSFDIKSGEATIKNPKENLVLLPFVETNSAFIFYLPNKTDDPEVYNAFLDMMQNDEEIIGRTLEKGETLFFNFTPAKR